MYCVHLCLLSSFIHFTMDPDLECLVQWSNCLFPEERCCPEAPKLVPFTAQHSFQECYISLFRKLNSSWADDIRIARKLTSFFALHVTYYDDDGKLQFCHMWDHHCCYWGITVVLDTADHFTWYDVLQFVRQKDAKCRLEYATVRAPTAPRNSIPKMLYLLGGVLPHLQHLECQLNHEKPCREALWADAFQLFPKLQSLIIDNGGSYVLQNVHLHCKELKTLVLRKFALTTHVAHSLGFPLLELLIIDEIDYYGVLEETFPMGQPIITLPKLTHLTVQISAQALLVDSMDRLDRFILGFNLPQLKSLTVSDIATHFLYLRQMKQMTTLTMNMESPQLMDIRRIACFGMNKLESLRDITFQAGDCNLNMTRISGFLRELCTGFRRVIIEMSTTQEESKQFRFRGNPDPNAPMVEMALRNKAREQRFWNLRPAEVLETLKEGATVQ